MGRQSRCAHAYSGPAVREYLRLLPHSTSPAARFDAARSSITALGQVMPIAGCRDCKTKHYIRKLAIPFKFGKPFNLVGRQFAKNVPTPKALCNAILDN